MDRLAEQSRSPLRELLSLATPTVLQMASYTLMQFIDTYLLGRLGTTEAAAAVMSGLLAFAVMCFGIGVVQLVNTFASQHFGKGEYAACGRYLWQGIWFGVLWSVVLMPLGPLAGPMFRWMGHGQRLASLEATYLQISLIGTLVKTLSCATEQFMLAIDRPRAVFVAAATAVGANVIAALPLVLGWWGVQSRGVAGAAWAQNIGATVEALVILVMALGPGVRGKFHVLDWKPREREFAMLVKVGWPSGVQFVADVLAWAIFSAVVMAPAGEAAMAANMFTFRFMSVSFMPALGVGTAVAALVGRYIGMGRPDLAMHRAHLGFKVNATYMFACGLGFYLFRHELMRLFTSDPQVLHIGAKLLVFAAFYQFADALYCTYSGALRGAGDTFVPALATGLMNWSMSVGAGFFIVKTWPRFGAAGPWMAATVYGLTLSTFITIRFARGKWRHIRLVETASSARQVNMVEESNKLSFVK